LNVRAVILVLPLLLLAACVSAKPEPAPIEARGRAIAEANCGRCHAIGTTGDSPAPEAPPFRQLSEKYRVANLEEALAEGISVGHPMMPQFQFAPGDVDALIAYLQAIQDPRLQEHAPQ
jgi:mono/diheme cytochrome c family protein